MMGGSMRKAAIVGCVAAAVLLGGGAPALAQDPEPISVVEVEISGASEMDRLLKTASDVTEHLETRDGSRFVQIVTTDSELAYCGPAASGSVARSTPRRR
jgi:hypothetical protein